MRKYVIGFLILIGSQTGAAEPCVHVVERDLGRPEAEDVLAPLIWKVTLENRCDGSYQADLTVRFIDEHGEDLYQVQHLETVSRRERVDVEKEVYMPGRYVDAVVSFEVELRERERPY